MKTFEEVYQESIYDPNCFFNSKYLSSKEAFIDTLREAYRKPELQFLDDIFQQLYKKYKNSKNLELIIEDTSGNEKLTQDYEDILLMFAKYNILLIANNDKIKKINSNDDLGYNTFLNCKFDSKREYILFEVRNSFLKNFQKGNERFLRDLLFEFKDSYAHENTHEQQNKAPPGVIQRSYKQPQTSKMEDDENDAYYNQMSEASAYARGVAASLEGLFNYKELLEKFTTRKGIEELLKVVNTKASFEIYSAFSRYYDKKEQYPEVWKFFLWQVYVFFH
jgi:hypothetical protein